MDKSWIRYFLIVWICGLMLFGTVAGRRNKKVRGKEKVACEGDRMNLNCTSGKKLHIIRASYGRFVLSVCNDRDIMTGWNLMCMSIRSFQIVVDRCHGQESCGLDVNNNVFSDPCPGTVKYLQVSYICLVPEPTEPPATEAPPTTTTRATPTQPAVRPVVTTEIVLTPDKKVVYCPETIERGIYWPRTQASARAVTECPDNAKGKAKWTCGRSGDVGKWRGSPDLSLCTSKFTQDLEDLVNNGTSSQQVAQKVAEATRGQTMVGGDLIATSNILHESVRNFKTDISSDKMGRGEKMIMARAFSNALVESSSNMLDEKQEVSWKDLGNRKRKKEVATTMLHSLEQSAEEVAEVLDTPQTFKSEADNIIVEINVIVATPGANVQDQVFPKPDDTSRREEKMKQNQMVIPSGALRSGAHDGRVKVIFAVYDNIGQYMSPGKEQTTGTDQSEASNEEENQDGDKSGTIVNSNIISASFVGARHPVAIPEPLRYTMQHNQTENVTNPRCAYWNFDAVKFSGQWSTDGCRLVKSNKTHTHCECDHMTNFAILMDVVGVNLREEHVITLQVITYAGCLVSIVCLFICFITFVCFRNLQSDRNTIHKNLVLTLLLAEVLFLTGIGQVGNATMCSVIAGLLHFLFLCAFSWMCLEGIQLYIMLIEVFEAERSRVKWYYLGGYGVPVIVVAIAAAVFPGGYGTRTHCWLSTERGFIWSFVGPVVLVITVNVAMLSIAIYMMCKHANMSAGMKEKSKLGSISSSNRCLIRRSNDSIFTTKQSMKSIHSAAWIKSAFVLVVLLGLTWSFGVLYISSDTVVMAYIFTVLNALQGLFIFIFHCLMNDKVQKEWKKCVRRTSWLPECIRVGYGGEKVHVSTTPSRSNSSAGNYFTRLLSGRRNRKRSSTTSLPKSMIIKNNNANYDSYHDSGHGSSVFHESDGSGKCVDIANVMNDRLHGQSPPATTGYNRTPVSVYLPAYSKTEMLKQKQNGYDGLVHAVPEHHLDLSVDDMCHSEYSDADLFKMTDYSDEPRVKIQTKSQVSRIEEDDEGYGNDGYEVPVPMRRESEYDMAHHPEEGIYHVLIPDSEVPKQPIRDSGMVPDSPDPDSPDPSASPVLPRPPSIPEAPEKADATTSMADLHQSQTSVHSNSDNNDVTIEEFLSPETTLCRSEPDLAPNKDAETEKPIADLGLDKDALRSLPNLSYTNSAFEDWDDLTPFQRRSLFRRSGSDPGDKYRLGRAAGDSEC